MNLDVVLEGHNEIMFFMKLLMFVAVLVIIFVIYRKIKHKETYSTPIFLLGLPIFMVLLLYGAEKMKDWRTEYGLPYVESLPEEVIVLDDFYVSSSNGEDWDKEEAEKETQLVKIYYTENGVKRESQIFAYIKESDTKEIKYGYRLLKEDFGNFGKGKHLETVYYSKE